MSSFQERLQRALMLVFMVLCEHVGSILMPMMPRNWLYYGAAIVILAVMIGVVQILFTATRMVRDVKLMLVAQAIVQLMGLVLYRFKEMPDFYNMAIYVIVPLTYGRILWGSPTDGHVAMEKA